ncbi:MAG: hypothetical protein LRY53_03515 [Burkholderiaceae bacterium]|nr:hypothetical protein [Burkholderiaceae bacterium]MCD8564715.1 hypothetical protein [Burkholderiaceae bacterium]
MAQAQSKWLGQRGQALVEWMVVAALAMLAAVWAAGEFNQRAERLAAQGHAHWLRSVAGAIAKALEHDDANAWPAGGLFASLPVNALSPVQPWLDMLKQRGWLPQALAAPDRMPYEIRLMRLVSEKRCADDTCPVMVLLLALPKSDSQTPHPSAMLAELQGEGLAVTDLAPGWLAGAALRLANPLADRVLLANGTIGLLGWRADKPPPYVRLNESRQVNLAGGVQIGRLANVSATCHPDGTVMLGPEGKLYVCRDGQWQTVSEKHDHLRACIPPDDQAGLARALMRISGLWQIFGGGPFCRCPDGFAPLSFGGDRQRVGPVELEDGYACLRL